MHSQSAVQSEDEYSISDSPSSSMAFAEASMVFTLADKFGMTKFKDYQKDIIDAIIKGQDCLVIEPTGSGKSLCFQFPAIHENKKAISITPTISLIQDHVRNAEDMGLNAVYLGSAQRDLTAEVRAFQKTENTNSSMSHQNGWVMKAIGLKCMH